MSLQEPSRTSPAVHIAASRAPRAQPLSHTRTEGMAFLNPDDCVPHEVGSARLLLKEVPAIHIPRFRRIAWSGDYMLSAVYRLVRALCLAVLRHASPCCFLLARSWRFLVPDKLASSMSRPHTQVTACVACGRHGPSVGLVYLPPPPLSPGCLPAQGHRRTRRAGACRLNLRGPPNLASERVNRKRVVSMCVLGADQGCHGSAF